MIKINNKAVVYIICSVICGAIVSGIINNNVFAEDVNYEVNIASGINITIPSDTVTLNLNPFVTAFGSTDLPVTVKTNNPTGYTLTMSPSDDTTTSLTRTGGIETIPTLDDLSGGYTEQTFTTNKWGYKLATTNYLPFATSNEITTTNAPTAASGNTSTVTFAAKGDTTLTAGTYSLEITFAAVTNYVPPADVPTTCQTPVPGVTYMQEITDQNKATVMANMTPNQQYFLRDRRDETPYCVSNITTKNASNEDQNAIWMTQNLRITGTISATDSNFTGSDFNVSAYDLKTDGAIGRACYGVNNYNNACSHVPDADDLTTTGLTAEELGVWYNYAAATAGTITGDSNTTEATEDICPAGWSLPSYNTTKPTNSINSLTGSTYVTTFLPVNGGYYNSGSPLSTGNGYWWSTTAYNSYNRYYLIYNGSSSLSTMTYSRQNGMYLRCVRR